jgi:hypothetical protein
MATATITVEYNDGYSKNDKYDADSFAQSNRRNRQEGSLRQISWVKDTLLLHACRPRSYVLDPHDRAKYWDGWSIEWFGSENPLTDNGEHLARAVLESLA